MFGLWYEVKFLVLFFVTWWLLAAFMIAWILTGNAEWYAAAIALFVLYGHHSLHSNESSAIMKRLSKLETKLDEIKKNQGGE